MRQHRENAPTNLSQNCLESGGRCNIEIIWRFTPRTVRSSPSSARPRHSTGIWSTGVGTRPLSNTTHYPVHSTMSFRALDATKQVLETWAKADTIRAHCSFPRKMKQHGSDRKHLIRCFDPFRSTPSRGYMPHGRPLPVALSSERRREGSTTYILTAR